MQIEAIKIHSALMKLAATAAPLSHYEVRVDGQGIIYTEHDGVPTSDVIIGVVNTDSEWSPCRRDSKDAGYAAEMWLEDIAAGIQCSNWRSSEDDEALEIELV